VLQRHCPEEIGMKSSGHHYNTLHHMLYY